MKITTLSTARGIPFNNVFQEFAETYSLSEDVECYQLYYCPEGTPLDSTEGTSFADLDRIEFKSNTVILNVIDSIIDYSDNLDIAGLENFCAKHSDINFILFSPHLGLQRILDIPNLYCDEIISSPLKEPKTSWFKPCEKKSITNRFISLNADTNVHRILVLSYILSKNYSVNGDFTFDFDRPPFRDPSKYLNMGKMPDNLKSKFNAGLQRLKSKDLKLLHNIPPFDWSNIDPAANYNDNLYKSYENYGVEIITSTLYFERVPILTEKELQNIYAKTFPIYINGVGIVRELKKMFDFDLFDDIIDHSYDEIEDHFERMTAAIDRNQHLLNGSTNIQDLWIKNRHRFESNVQKLNSLAFDNCLPEYADKVQRQKPFNFNIIQKALTHFNITTTLI